MKMVGKLIDLGHGFAYHEIVKPSRVSEHQLKIYVQHVECGAWVNYSEEEYLCSECTAPAPREVIEKALCLLSMRVL